MIMYYNPFSSFAYFPFVCADPATDTFILFDLDSIELRQKMRKVKNS